MVGRLTKEEKNESMFVTWGRILTIIREYQSDERLKMLAEKLNKDIAEANIEEGYFKNI